MSITLGHGGGAHAALPPEPREKGREQAGARQPAALQANVPARGAPRTTAHHLYVSPPFFLGTIRTYCIKYYVTYYNMRYSINIFPFAVCQEKKIIKLYPAKVTVPFTLKWKVLTS